MRPLFKATQKFGPEDGKRWEDYCVRAKIPNLVEVVSLDTLLCPRILQTIEDEDWPHIVNEDFRLDYFIDLDYLLRRLAAFPRRNVLGLYRDPAEHLELKSLIGDFTFAGYDLIENETQISALTNCGGFPNSFSNAELNCFGLVPDFERAREIQRRLAELNPKEPHAHCDCYAIWRLNENK